MVTRVECIITFGNGEVTVCFQEAVKIGSFKDSGALLLRTTGVILSERDVCIYPEKAEFGESYR